MYPERLGLYMRLREIHDLEAVKMAALTAPDQADEVRRLASQLLGSNMILREVFQWATEVKP